MKRNVFIIGLLLLLTSYEGVWADCAIEKGPPEALVKYMSDVRTELAQIKSEASKQNQCKGENGSFSSENRFLSFLDSIDLEGSLVDNTTNIPQDMLMDFVYSITFASEGNSRSPVTNQGKLFKDLENGSIVKTLESVSTMCALDIPLSSGGTPESRIGTILRNNRKIERFFWKVTTGDPTFPDGLEKYSSLLESIRDNYALEKTSACKSQYNIESSMSDIMDRIGNITHGTKDANKAWEEAIELFQGKNKGTAQYMKLQSQLLETEMARQGLSQNAKKAIMKNLTCPEQRTDPTSSPEDKAKADYDCQRSYVTGLDTFSKPFEGLIFKSKTTDEYIARQITYSREKSRLSDDMNNFYSTLVGLKSNDEPLNDKILNDLVNIHTELLVTTDALKPAIKKMIKNCGLGQPNIECPQNLDY